MQFTRQVALLVLLCTPLLANAGDINQDLTEAAQKGDTATVKALLAKGADINALGKEGGTALVEAARNGHTDTVRALLAAGADVNAKDKDGRTALTVAATQGHTDVVQLLEKAGILQVQMEERSLRFKLESRWQEVMGAGMQANAEGHYAEAEKMFLSGLEQAEKLDPGHMFLVYSLTYLEKFYAARGEYTKAEALYKRALANLESTPGPENPINAVILSQLGKFYYSQRRYAEAEPLYKRSLNIYEKVADPADPYSDPYYETLKDYAALLRKLGREAEAAQTEARAESMLAKARREVNEVVAIGRLRNLVTAATVGFRRTHPKLAYPRSLAELGPSGAELIGGELAAGLTGGYRFIYRPGRSDSQGRIETFTIVARPVEYGHTGQRNFFTDESGVIRWTHEDREATAQDRPIG
jgi:ankyrin repeat protein